MAIDLYVISLFRYAREGGEKRWSFLRFQFASGVESSTDDRRSSGRRRRSSRRATSYVDASVRVDGTLLDWTFVDVDEDGRDELALSARNPRGDRELHLHRVRSTSVEPEPYVTIPVLDDIVAWTFADVRAELEGKELVLLTRQGAWSFDPRRTSYRGNIARLCEVQLLYDVPSPRALPYWLYVLDGAAPGCDRLLLPERSGFAAFGPNPRAAEGSPVDGLEPVPPRVRVDAARSERQLQAAARAQREGEASGSLLTHRRGAHRALPRRRSVAQRRR